MERLEEGYDLEDSGIDYERDVLPVLEDWVPDTFYDTFNDKAEMHGNGSDGEELEYQSRSGFISSIDGGWESSDYAILSYELHGLPKDAQKEVDRIMNDAYKYAQDEFASEYPEIVRELGKDNIDYTSLQDAGYDDEAEVLDEYERSWTDDVAVQFYLRVMFNYDERGDYITVQAWVGFDEYGRDSYGLVQKEYTFASVRELESALKKAEGEIKKVWK